MRALALSCVLLLSHLAAAEPRPHVEPAPVPDAGPMPTLIRRFETDRSDVRRFYDLPWSEARLDRLASMQTSWQESLRKIDFDALDQNGKVDYVLLATHLEHEQSQLSLARRQLTEIADLLPFRETCQGLLSATWRLEPVDSEQAAGALAPMAKQIKDLRERIEQGRKKDQPADGAAKLTVTPVLAKRASAAVGAIRWQLQQWYDFHAGYKPEFSWWVRKPFEDARGALDDYARYLREDIAEQKGADEDPLVGDPIGRDALLADLKAEMIAYTPEEMIAIGDRELAWCEAELKKAAAEMGLGDDWKAALARVKADHMPPGRQDELATEQVRFAIQWLKDRDLVTIPPLCEETWRLRMITPLQQKIWPFAVYFGQAMGVSYPTDDMKHEDKLMSMRGNNRHFNRIVAPHELIPGHHLQGYVESRVRPYRQMFSTPFLVEGWALHWEMELWDRQYPRTPEERIGMLFWRIHRCARITVSLRYHLGEMTPPQMIDFLVERVGHERFGATSEVRRYISGDYSPLYQCGYMIGGLQLRALEADLTTPGAMSPRDFHDAVLGEGPIPIELIRASLQKSPLSRDFTPAWRFAGEVSTQAP